MTEDALARAVHARCTGPGARGCARRPGQVAALGRLDGGIALLTRSPLRAISTLSWARSLPSGRSWGSPAGGPGPDISPMKDRAVSETALERAETRLEQTPSSTPSWSCPEEAVRALADKVRGSSVGNVWGQQ